MNVQQVVDQLALDVVNQGDLTLEITGGYASDLLSCVMAGAQAGHVWVTLQSHPNVIAVASLLELAAVIVTEGTIPDEETVHKANQEEINLLVARQDTFAVVARLAVLGVHSAHSG